MKNIVWLGFAFFLSVLCALPADGDVVVAKPGQRVRLLCGLQGDGSNLGWYHQENLVFRVLSKSGMPQKGKADIISRATLRHPNLEILSVKETDAGMFTCKANGNSKQHLLILVTVSAGPSNVLQLGSDATLQCRVKGPDPEPAVQWRKPDGTPHPESQVAHLKPVARSDAGAWNCTFSYDGKTYSERLDISVKEPAPAPVTPREKSKDPNCKDCGVITSPTSPPLLPLLQRLHWWIWVVVGAGCLIVVVLLVLVINLWKRVQRKKRKLKRMENSRQQLMAKQYCQCSSPTAAPKLQQRRLREKPSRPPLQPLPVQ